MTVTIAVAALSAIALAGVGGLLTDVGPWYRALRKPRLQPPDWLFGPAWTVILGLAAWSGVLAWQGAPDAEAHVRVVTVYAVNALFHLAWSPLFFRLHRPDWSLAESCCLWSSIVALIWVVTPFSTLAGWLLAPYLIWVTFATWLNWAIVRLNAPFGAARLKT